MMSPHPLRLLLPLLAFALAACTPATRLDKITTVDESSYDKWIAAHAKVLSPEDLKELNEARQQLRFKVMQAQPGMMSDAFAAALYAEINGKTVDELVQISYDMQLERAKVALANYEPMLAKQRSYAQIQSLTDSQKESVEHALKQLTEKMAVQQAEVQRLEEKLAAFKRRAAASPR